MTERKKGDIIKETIYGTVGLSSNSYTEDENWSSETIYNEYAGVVAGATERCKIS